MASHYNLTPRNITLDDDTTFYNLRFIYENVHNTKFHISRQPNHVIFRMDLRSYILTSNWNDDEMFVTLELATLSPPEIGKTNSTIIQLIAINERHSHKSAFNVNFNEIQRSRLLKLIDLMVVRIKEEHDTCISYFLQYLTDKQELSIEEKRKIMPKEQPPRL